MSGKPSPGLPGYVLLEDGTRLDGELCGAAPGGAAQVTGEAVFNTAMTGYQESVTDPSYAGQIITYTYPLIGNYGVAAEAMESAGPQARGVVIRGGLPRAYYIEIRSPDPDRVRLVCLVPRGTMSSSPGVATTLRRPTTMRTTHEPVRAIGPTSPGTPGRSRARCPAQRTPASTRTTATPCPLVPSGGSDPCDRHFASRCSLRSCSG